MTYDPTGDATREPESSQAPPGDPETPTPVPEPGADPGEPEAAYCAPTDVFGSQPLGWDEEPPDEYEPPRATESGAPVAGVLIVILSLGLLACGAWAVKLHREKALVSASFDQTLGMIAEVAPAELGAQLSTLRGDLQVGRLDDVNTKISTLAGQVRQAMASGGGRAGGVPTGPIPESAYKQLPADAATFFRQHEELFRRFVAMADRARQLRDQGQDVTALRKVRDAAIEAARLGQADKVETHMMQMARMLGGGGSGPGGAVPGRLASRVEAFKQATQQAVRQGRDPRAAVAVARQAEQAAEAGNMDKAEQLLDQAITQVKRAPRARGGPGGAQGWGGRGLAQRANPLNGLIRTLLQIMHLEERDLSVVWAQLTKLRKGLKGPEEGRQPGVLEPFVDTALQGLQTVAGRRRELSVRMQGRTPQAAGQPNGAPQLGQLDANRDRDRQRMLAILSDRLTPLLERIRTLSEVDFIKDREKFLNDITKAVLQPPTEEEMAASRSPLTPGQQQDAQPERIRAKMLKGSGALQQQELAGKDTTEVQNLFSEARKLLYAGELDRAEGAVDKALTLLGIPLEPFGPRPRAGAGGSAGLQPPGELYDPDAAKLRLGPSGRDRRSQPAADGSAPAVP